MRSTSYLPQLLTVFVVSAAAAAQTPFGFPLNQRFVAISLNGQNYAAKSPTLAVKLDANRNVLTGAGFAGCNTWSGQITLGDRQFGVGDLGTTKMFCADQMAAEAGFLTAMKSVTRWRMDGPRLVLEGERTTLLLSPAALAAPNQP
jgi:heat shock protein HslJ